MKLVIFLAAITIGFSAQAGISLRSRASATILQSRFLTSSVLSGLSTQRCLTVLREMGLHKSPSTNRSCLSLLKDFSGLLDLAVILREETGQYYPVIFHTRLLEILRDPRIPLLTKQLQQELSMALAYDYRFSLFDIVRRFTRDENETLEWIAVLFQDVTPLRLHLRWALAQSRTPDEQERVRRLADHLDELWRIIHLDKSHASRIELYPASAAQSLGDAKNPKLYHFYIPLWLTHRALESGYPKELSVYLGYHFNFLYEALGQGVNPSIAWQDPERLRGRESTRDAYLGLRGSLYVLNPVLNPIPADEFMERALKDVPGSHRTLLAVLGWYFRWSKDF